MDNQKSRTHGLHKRRDRSNVPRVSNTGNNAWKNEGKIKDQPIIAIETKQKIMDTHLYLDKERFQIKKEKRKTSYV